VGIDEGALKVHFRAEERSLRAADGRSFGP
jgi:hypothetical protein